MCSIKKAVNTLRQIQEARIADSNRLRDVTMILPGWEKMLRARLLTLEHLEEEVVEDISQRAKEHPLWDAFFKDVKGIGPGLAGVIIAAYGPRLKAKTVGQMWAYAGLHVLHICTSCGKEVVVRTDVTSDDDSGDAQKNLTCHECGGRVRGQALKHRKGKPSNWNGFLRAKLLGVAGPCLLRAGRRADPPTLYQQLYRTHREYLLTRQCTIPVYEHKGTLCGNGCSNGHMHNKAMRYMIKRLLHDMFLTWRKIEEGHA